MIAIGTISSLLDGDNKHKMHLQSKYRYHFYSGNCHLYLIYALVTRFLFYLFSPSVSAVSREICCYSWKTYHWPLLYHLFVNSSSNRECKACSHGSKNFHRYRHPAPSRDEYTRWPYSGSCPDGRATLVRH